MRVTPDLAPMELRAVATIPDGEGWQYEPKWDGFRALAHRDGVAVAVTSKNGQPLARYFPEVVAALAIVPADGFSLDGELVVMQAGALSFDALSQRIHPAASRIAMLARTTPAFYLAFDLLRETAPTISTSRSSSDAARWSASPERSVRAPRFA